jgi:predicted peptidase
MTRTTQAIFFLLMATGLIASEGCASTAQRSGYYKTKQTTNQDAADKAKAAIRAISNDVFQPFQYTGANKIPINYRFLSPLNVSNQEQYPLVLVLHGSGAIGTDNVSQLGILAKLWAQPDIREKYPAYIVVPQFPQRSSNYVMDKERKVLVSIPDPCLTTALQLIDSLKKVLPIDARKIYVTGFSMGGSGSVNSLMLRPDLFAAAVPVSGVPAFTQPAVLVKTPLWIIHGNADNENPFNSDSLLYHELSTTRTPQFRFWEIEGLGHDVYSELHTSDILPRWLFRQKRK